MSKKKGDVMRRERQIFVYGDEETQVPGTVLSPGQGHIFIRRLLADDHPGRMHGTVPGQPFQTF